MVIGKEAFELYLLDKNVVKEVQFSHTLPTVCCNKLPYPSMSLDVSYNHISNNISFDIWHRRIGYVPL